MEFTESPDGLAVVGAAVIGEPPPERLEGLYKTILSANHLFAGTGGATRASRDLPPSASVRSPM